MIWGSGGWKITSLKRRVRSQLARWEMKIALRCGAKHVSKSKVSKTHGLRPLLKVEMSKKCTRWWREAHVQVKSVKNPRSQTTFGSWDVEKVRAVVARSAIPTQNVQNTPCSDLLKIEMSKKCTPLWHEAHFQVKTVKNWRSRTTFLRSESKKKRAVVARSTFPSQNCKKLTVSHHLFTFRVEKVHAVVARSTFPSQNVQSTKGSDHFWKLCGAKHISKSKVSKHQGSDHFLTFRCRQSARGCGTKMHEAHVQVKSVENWGFCTFFDVQMWKKWTLINLTNCTNSAHLTTLTSTTI